MVRAAAPTGMRVTVAAGREVYSVDAGRVLARGRVHSRVQRDRALDGAVRALIEDHAGRAAGRLSTASLALTGFETKNLEAVLAGGPSPKDWQVGEALAEAYLESNKQCRFPWSDRWDERKEKSSLPGADLVGFQRTSDTALPVRFAFGEVKTSSQEAYPPSVMHGSEGLKQQLEDLRDRKRIRHTLMRYLMFRAVGAAWEGDFRSAVKRYLAATTDVVIFGFLVRDVPPDARDLTARAKGLSVKHPRKMQIELLALYLPAGSIAGFSGRYRGVRASKKKRSRDRSAKSTPRQKKAES